jgi:hypothetical protein
MGKTGVMHVGAIMNAPDPDSYRSRTDARMLDRAEGILVGLRRCTVEAAFDEIVSASRRNRVPALRMACALVALAENSAGRDNNDAIDVARREWGEFLQLCGQDPPSGRLSD